MKFSGLTPDSPEIAHLLDGIPRPSNRHGDIGDQIRRDTGNLLRPLHDDHAMSLREISAATGLSYGYIRTCLQLAGVKLRQRGSNNYPGHVLSRPLT